MNDSPSLLFVYGTLRLGFPHPQARQLHRCAEYLSGAWWQARLYDLGNYPGALPSHDPADRVRGELFALNNEIQLLDRLDRYEGASQDFPEPREYQREAVLVTTDRGDRLYAWTYLYQWGLEGAARIAGGDYRRWYGD